MGTNYYGIRKNDICHHCGHIKDFMHIGKSAVGWQFSFRGYKNIFPPIISFKGLMDFLKSEDMIIQDQYEKEISHTEFIEFVKRKQASETANHAIEYPDGNWIDEDGYSFNGQEFS